jgi:ribosomal protein L35AE/L33A
MSQLTIQQVKDAIAFGNFTNEQLSLVADAVKYRRAQIVNETKRALVKGDVVRFTHPKTGRVHQGAVVKIAIKNIKVKEGFTTWNVPASMISIAE